MVETEIKKPNKLRFSASIYFAIFQVLFVVLFAYFAAYHKNDTNDKSPSNLYPMFMDVHSMMFVGFGFLMTFLKRYGFSSVGFNFVIAAYVLEWALLVRGFLDAGHEGHSHFSIGFVNLLVADFCAAAVLISFGAVLGKASLSQLIIMATFEVIIQSVNEHIGLHFFKAYDIGESIYVHVFGAYFGLAVAQSLQRKKEVESPNEGSIYHADIFSMIGTLFLWLYWPSFNSATAQAEGQLRAVVNTYLAISASCIMSFAISKWLGKGKLNMVHIQNATLAGGVAVGAVADMVIGPHGAMIIGSLAGAVSTFGFHYLSPKLNVAYVHDTCGVNNLHGIPGLISALASAVVAVLATRETYNGNRLYTFYPSRAPVVNSTDYVAFNLTSSEEYAAGGLGRTGLQQAGWQLAALALTLFTALVGGKLTGYIMKLPFFEHAQVASEELFDDEPSWIVPEDFRATYLYYYKSIPQPNELNEINELKHKAESLVAKSSKSDDEAAVSDPARV